MIAMIATMVLQTVALSNTNNKLHFRGMTGWTCAPTTDRTVAMVQHTQPTTICRQGTHLRLALLLQINKLDTTDKEHLVTLKKVDTCSVQTAKEWSGILLQREAQALQTTPF